MAATPQSTLHAGILGTAIDAAPAAVFVTDEHGRFVAANAFACHMLGVEREELLGMNLADVAAAGDLPLPRDGTPRIGIAPLRHRNGRTVTVRYHVRALRSTAPALAVWVGMPRREQRATAPPDPRRSRDRDRLSPRELEILQLMADGLENEEIARELYISPETVKSHVRRILQKLGAHSRTYAVAVALRRSLVD